MRPFTAPRNKHQALPARRPELPDQGRRLSAGSEQRFADHCGSKNNSLSPVPPEHLPSLENLAEKEKHRERPALGMTHCSPTTVPLRVLGTNCRLWRQGLIGLNRVRHRR